MCLRGSSTSYVFKKSLGRAEGEDGRYILHDNTVREKCGRDVRLFLFYLSVEGKEMQRCGKHLSPYVSCYLLGVCHSQ